MQIIRWLPHGSYFCYPLSAKLVTFEQAIVSSERKIKTETFVNTIAYQNTTKASSSILLNEILTR